MDDHLPPESTNNKEPPTPSAVIIASVLAENPEFDKPTLVLLELLLDVKQSGAHGKTGVSVPHKNGELSPLVYKIQEHTTLTKN